MGKDALPGTTLVDVLELFYQDEQTKVIILIGEIGGTAEVDAAESIDQYRRNTKNPKPIIAMVADKTVPDGRTMGHAGALLSPGEKVATAEAKALENVGAVIVPHPGFLGSELRKLLTF